MLSLSVTDESVEINGLPWLEVNTPDLWRLPKQAMQNIPDAVSARAVSPGGARIRLASNTTRLTLHVEIVSAPANHGLDLYVDNTFWRSILLTGSGETQVDCFTDMNNDRKEITVYLPYRHEIRILNIGIDDNATLEPPAPFACQFPLVLYGSSIAQGADAARPAMTYHAILARMLNVDFINFGFGGAGKAEPDVVQLVSEPEACCYMFDLGKSYGMQSADVYAAMLKQIRTAKPNVPLVCVTPIYSAREIYVPGYEERSQHIRDITVNAARACGAGSDNTLTLVDGLDLLGPADTDGFAADGLHPNDLGHSLIAQRLLPIIRPLLPTLAT